MTIVEKIKLLFAVRKPVGDLVVQVKQVKAGWKTPGFWVAVLGTLLALAGAVSSFIPATAALIVSTVLTLGYNVLRAYQNAAVPGVCPPFQSSRFWVGVLGMASASIMALQQGGVNPEWFTVAISILGAVMAAAQSIGAQQPEKTSKVEQPS